MRPDAKVSNIIDKLETQYGQVASFYTLQSFYRVVHEKGEHILTFMARLEGSLNLLQLLFWYTSCVYKIALENIFLRTWWSQE